MAYQVNKTDGALVATVADGQLDTLSTDLTLIGKNYSGFGEALNENFIKLLENFANTARPTNPIRGQIWFDTSELKLKVYSGTEFIPVSSATISNRQPLSLGVGDLWFNDIDKQLYFYDGITTILLGPSYSASQGLSGLKTESILDTLNQTRVITSLYNSGILLGIFAKDSFTPKITIAGFTGDINPGFNAGNLENLKFNGTATNSDTLGKDSSYPEGIPSDIYIRKDQANTLTGQLQIKSNEGIVVGTGDQFGIIVSNSGDVTIANSATARSMNFSVRSIGNSPESAIAISSADRIIDMYQGFPTSQVNVGGNLTVTGNLTVIGDTLTVVSENLTIEDKIITLANTQSPTDVTADGGGIVLKGSTDHTLIWTEDSTAWNSSEHINLAESKEFKIGGDPVLNSTTCFVSSFPNLTAVGTLTELTVGPYPGGTAEPQLKLENNNISTLLPNLDLEIEPNGNGNVALIGSPKITGLADPVEQQDAATKEYVDAITETRAVVFSMDLSDGKDNSYIVSNILNELAPPSEHRDGTYARILCTVLTNGTTSLDIDPLISTSTVQVNTPTGTANVLGSVAISSATISSPAISTQRIIKVFRLESGVWVWKSNTVLPV
jgi:hypothetical protein